MDKKKILEKLNSLSDEYWINRFKAIEQDRQKKNEDLVNELTYLFSLTSEEATEILTAFFAKLERDKELNYVASTQRITRVELTDLKSFISQIEKDLLDEGLALDKDLQKEVKAVSLKMTKSDAVILKIKLLIFYLYSVSEKRISDHMYNVAKEQHAHTIYEVFKAAGYGTKKIKTLSDDDLILLLALYWRSTEETYDDAIWRYGRTKMVEASQLIKRSAFIESDTDIVTGQLEKQFKSGLNELKSMVATDSTFYATEGEKKAFQALVIEEAVFTAIIDERTSDFCLEADGNVIPVEDITPWENAPPLHYHCRSTMIPIVKSVDFLTGDTYELDVNFDDWYKYN